METCFEISDRYYQDIGPWPLAVGDSARALLYAFRDHSRAARGRVLLPDLALAPVSAQFTLRRSTAALTAFCGMISTLRTHRFEGRDRREETTIQLDCGVPLALVLQTWRWDHVEVAPIEAPRGLAPWQAARAPRVADVLCGVVEVQELAFEVGGVSSFSLLDEDVPAEPMKGTIAALERLNLDPSSRAFGSLEPLESLPEGPFWPHRYWVTLRV